MVRFVTANAMAERMGSLSHPGVQHEPKVSEMSTFKDQCALSIVGPFRQRKL